MESNVNRATNQERPNGVWQKRFFDLVAFVKSYSWFDERADFYGSLAANLQKVVGADSVNIRLLAPGQDSFVLYAHHGDVEQEVNREFGVLSAGAGRMPHLIETGEPIVFDFQNPEAEDIVWERGSRNGFFCSVTVALPGVQGIVGAADFLFREPRTWSEQDIAWLRALGEFVGATIGNALLSDNMFGLRIAEERRNLSREIHDNVAQSASVISLEAENALDSLAHGETDALRHDLDLIKRASEELETAIRGELSNLNAGPDPDEDPSMEQLETAIATLCRQWGLAFDISSTQTARTTIIPKRVMVQLTRVVNEALVNVIRHAGASKTQISYEVGVAGLSMSICDDGCGFNVDDVSPTRLGLRIMRERLERIGASLSIESSPGAGTCINITVPYLV